MDGFLNGFRALVLGLGFSIASIHDELRSALHSVGITDNVIDFIKVFIDHLTWQELALEGIIYPIIGVNIVRAWFKLTKKKETSEAMAKEIQELKDKIKKLGSE